MKKFNYIIVKGQKINGTGYFQKEPNELTIEAEDHVIRKHFLDAMRNNLMIGSINFIGENFDSFLSGDFMVTNVSGNTILLKKT